MVFSFLIVLLFNFEIYSECLPKEESYEKYLKNAYIENIKSIDLLKKHLACYPDKEVFLLLAKHYEYHKHYYLAGLAYQKAGNTTKFNEIEQLRIKNNIKYGDSKIKELSGKKAVKFEKAYKKRKAVAVSFLTTGAVLFGTGFGLFLHDKAFNGTNSMAAQYSLMFTGLALISGGITVNGFSNYYKNLCQGFRSLSEKNYSPDDIMDPDYVFQASTNKAKRNSAKSLRNHGGLLIGISIPMIALSIYSIYESVIFIASRETISDMDIVPGIFYGPLLLIAVVVGGVITLAPGALSLTGGIVMLKKASNWKKLNANPTLFTLKSISPMINPITKTYGISMGFSF